jgi:hypothetical protein
MGLTMVEFLAKRAADAVKGGELWAKVTTGETLEATWAKLTTDQPLEATWAKVTTCETSAMIRVATAPAGALKAVPADTTMSGIFWPLCAKKDCKRNLGHQVGDAAAAQYRLPRLRRRRPGQIRELYGNPAFHVQNFLHRYLSPHFFV